MKSAFIPRLVNHPFGDPGLYVAFRYEGRAMQFDLGRIDRQPAPLLLKVTHVFVSHTHMDHFIGFDHLLRVFLAHDSHVELYGPAGIIKNVCGKLAGYTWNLVENYPFVVTVHEVGHDQIEAVRLAACTAFTPEPLAARPFDGVLYDAPDCAVTTRHLDHKIPCLGFALTEKTRLNVRPDQLAELNIPAGRWLNQLKDAIRQGVADDAPFEVDWRAEGQPRSATFTLGELRSRLIVETPGQKIAYIVDILFSRDNIERIGELAQDASILYCESPFLDSERDQARARHHLTARQAGTIALAVEAKRLETFHYSPRYNGNAALLRTEAQAVLQGELEPDRPED
jgi:ribonuclease Z